MTSGYRILYLPGAVQELLEIHDMIASYAGIDVAAQALGDRDGYEEPFPLALKASIRDGLPAGLRAIPASKKAVICFSVDEQSRTVRIIAFSHAGSDWMSKARIGFSAWTKPAENKAVLSPA